jgi:hypothetical protein
MRIRVLVSCALAVIVATSSIAAQGSSSSRAKPAASAKAAKLWTAPRTPWGDPDLQGVFTNNDESGIPLERPKTFEGRTLAEVSEQGGRAGQSRVVGHDRRSGDVDQTVDLRDAPVTSR